MTVQRMTDPYRNSRRPEWAPVDDPTTARAHFDAAALDTDAVLRVTSVPGLLQALIRLTHAIASTPDEAAADRLRVSRVRVSDEIVRRTGAA